MLGLPTNAYGVAHSTRCQGASKGASQDRHDRKTMKTWRLKIVLGEDAGTINNHKKTAYSAVGVVCLLGSLAGASGFVVSEAGLAPLPPSLLSL